MEFKRFCIDGTKSLKRFFNDINKKLLNDETKKVKKLSSDELTKYMHFICQILKCLKS